MRVLFSLVAPVLMAAVAASAGARLQTPEVDAVLDKAAEYVSAYKRDFVGVVADETYRQEVRGGQAGTDLRGFPIDSDRARQDGRKAGRRKGGKAGTVPPVPVKVDETFAPIVKQ